MIAPYSQCVVAGDAGVQTPAAAATADQLPGADAAGVHALADGGVGPQLATDAGAVRQTGRFHNNSSMRDLILP